MTLPACRPCLVLLTLSVLVTMETAGTLFSVSRLKDGIYRAGMLVTKPKKYCSNDKMAIAGHDACQIVRFLPEWEPLDRSGERNPGAWVSLGSSCCDSYCQPDDFYKACGFRKLDAKLELKRNLTAFVDSIKNLQNYVTIDLRTLRRKLGSKSKNNADVNEFVAIKKELTTTHKWVRRLRNGVKRRVYYLTEKIYKKLNTSLPELVEILTFKRKFLDIHDDEVDDIIKTAQKIKRLLKPLWNGSKRNPIWGRRVEVAIPPGYLLCGAALVASTSGKCSDADSDECNPNPCGPNQNCHISGHSLRGWDDHDRLATCTCKENFAKDDLIGCVKASTCPASVCVDRREKCVPRPTSSEGYECICKDNYKRDLAGRCRGMSDKCRESPCHAAPDQPPLNQTCLTRKKTALGYECKCNGHTEDGYYGRHANPGFVGTPADYRLYHYKAGCHFIDPCDPNPCEIIGEGCIPFGSGHYCHCVRPQTPRHKILDAMGLYCDYKGGVTIES